MIQIDQISKYYKPDIVALKDITFNIETGEFLFLVGPSGAGKSTLIRLIIRQERPSEGNILFDDTNVGQLKRSLLPFYRQQIGVVFQDYKLVEQKTVRENIEFALEITGKTDKEIHDTTNSLLDIVNLAKRQHLFPSQLSGGEKQRAGIARALANDPKLLIADEPTGNLDPKTALEILSILQTINNWGTTVLIATHDRDIVNATSRRVVRLEQGLLKSDHIGGYYEGARTKKPAQTKPEQNHKQMEKMQNKIAPQRASGAPDSNLGILGLPKGILETLQENDIHTIDTLLDMSETELKDLNGIGKKKAQKIVAALEKYISSGQR